MRKLSIFTQRKKDNHTQQLYTKPNTIPTHTNGESLQQSLEQLFKSY